MNQTISKVRVTSTGQHAYKPNLFQAELRQKITREYNANTISNNMQSAFAPKEAFQLPETKYEKERVCWVDIPKGWTSERAQLRLDELYASGANPCIYQVLSFEPIFTDNDYAWMGNLSTDEREAFIENKKNNQVILDPESGEVATREGKTIYRKLFYADHQRDDMDFTRGQNVSAVDAKEQSTTQETAKAPKPELVF